MTSKLRFLPTALLMTSAGLTLACGDSRTFGSPPVADASAGAGGQGGSIGPGGGQSDGSGGSLAESGSDADRQTSLSELVFEEQFTPAPDAVEDSAVGQCGNPGRLAANFDAWTANVRINTDSRPGGCQQSFAIKDPAHALASATLKITFEPDGDPAQCGQPGDHVVPITATGAEWSAYYTIDTDDRSGGCTETFALAGVNDVVLDVDFEPDPDAADAGATQCGNPGVHTVSAGNPVTIRIDTDGLPGGCLERFRLRSGAADGG